MAILKYMHTCNIKCEIMIFSEAFFIPTSFLAETSPNVALVVFCFWTESSESSNFLRDKKASSLPAALHQSGGGEGVRGRGGGLRRRAVSAKTSPTPSSTEPLLVFLVFERLVKSDKRHPSRLSTRLRSSSLIFFPFSFSLWKTPRRPWQCKHVSERAKWGLEPRKGAHPGQHEPQREARGVRGAGSHRHAGRAAREGVERGNSHAHTVWCFNWNEFMSSFCPPFFGNHENPRTRETRRTHVYNSCIKKWEVKPEEAARFGMEGSVICCNSWTLK